MRTQFDLSAIKTWPTNEPSIRKIVFRNKIVTLAFFSIDKCSNFFFYLVL